MKTVHAPASHFLPLSNFPLTRALRRIGLFSTLLPGLLIHAFPASVCAQDLVDGDEKIGGQGPLSADDREIVSNSTITLSATTTFVFRFASDYNAYAAVISGDSVSNFINGGSFSYFSAFDGNFGTQSVTLGPGTYAVGVMNRTDSANSYKVELDLPASISNAGPGETVLNEAEYVGANGGKLWHSFTISDGYYYYMDGANSSLDSYILPASEIENFKAGGSFNHYSNYSGSGDTNQPGGFKISLNPGEYYLCFANPNDVQKSVVYTLQRFAISTTGGGSGGGTGDDGGITGAQVELEGSTSYRINGKAAFLNAAKIVNSGDSTSGTLQLRLWATKRRYTGGSINGYVVATRRLGELSAGYSYNSIQGRVPYKKPRRGSYFMTLTLEEYKNGGFVVIDSVSFSSKFNVR
ncbi:MAG: hypothetical protein RLZZ214_2012 [Verrucomicrobiota bacterium]|jgi:hypothetical protein